MLRARGTPAYVGIIQPQPPTGIPPAAPGVMTGPERDDPIRILIVDDEETLARSCLQILTAEGYEGTFVTRGAAAIEAVRRQTPDIVLADLVLPDMDGLELLREIHRVAPETLVIMITGFATVSSSVEAIQSGAYDYIPKPFTAMQLRILIGRAAQRVLLLRDNARLRHRLRQQRVAPEILGSSEPIRRVLSLIQRVAPSDASVFVSGESGTGKELVARALHEHSRRSERPFVAINCAALPDQLLESELFGYERGAFTGAEEQRPGLLERASGGSFLLDEITEMSLDLQAKLLRVVQERRIRRVGGSTEIPIDVRWISATNRDPEQAVREGQLRQDLYFRLNVVPIPLPPLRTRLEDIPTLVHEFLRRFVQEYGKPGVRIGPTVIRALAGYHWPGNVRELQNVVERMVSLSDGGEVTLDDLPDGFHRPHPDGNGSGRQQRGSNGGSRSGFHEAKSEAIARFERSYLQDLLDRHGGNISRAAREAGIDRKTIHRMLAKHDLHELHEN
jgi:DNA-binding NtrC family response regulator